MATRAALAQVGAQIAMFEIDHGRYPDSLDDLLRRPAWIKPERWRRPYLSEPPRDAWNNSLVYRCEGGRFVLISLGKDRREGTEDDIVHRPPTCEHDAR